jgi:hypothetical protein
MAHPFASNIGRRGKRVLNHPVRVSDIDVSEDFAELYEKISEDWQRRAKDLLTRREAAILKFR